MITVFPRVLPLMCCHFKNYSQHGPYGHTLCPTKCAEIPPLPNAVIKQRVLSFKTLTKSYFGPAYASATKTQRVTKISKRLLVLENQTKLADIPFADRFHVIERWVIEAVKRNDAGLDESTHYTPSPDDSMQQQHSKPSAPYTSKLTVYVQVQMLKPCSWEDQIRKRTQTTVTDLVESWCKKAKEVLRRTEEKKLERLRREAREWRHTVEGHSLGEAAPSAVVEKGGDPVASAADGNGPEDAAKNKRECARSFSDAEKERTKQLIAMHLEKLRELEAKIVLGDLEWCSVEVEHSAESSQDFQGPPAVRVFELDEWHQRNVNEEHLTCSNPADDGHDERSQTDISAMRGKCSNAQKDEDTSSLSSVSENAPWMALPHSGIKKRGSKFMRFLRLLKRK